MTLRKFDALWEEHVAFKNGQQEEQPVQETREVVSIDDASYGWL